MEMSLRDPLRMHRCYLLRALVVAPETEVFDLPHRQSRPAPRGTTAVTETQTVTILGEAEGNMCWIQGLKTRGCCCVTLGQVA